MADVYDALKQPRCYKPGRGEPRVIGHFLALSGTLYETSLVEALLDSMPNIRSIEQALRDEEQSEFAASGNRLKASLSSALAEPGDASSSGC